MTRDFMVKICASIPAISMELMGWVFVTRVIHWLGGLGGTVGSFFGTWWSAQRLGHSEDVSLALAALLAAIVLTGFVSWIQRQVDTGVVPAVGVVGGVVVGSGSTVTVYGSPSLVGRVDSDNEPPGATQSGPVRFLGGRSVRLVWVGVVLVVLVVISSPAFRASLGEEEPASSPVAVSVAEIADPEATTGVEAAATPPVTPSLPALPPSAAQRPSATSIASPPPPPPVDPCAVYQSGPIRNHHSDYFIADDERPRMGSALSLGIKPAGADRSGCLIEITEPDGGRCMDVVEWGGAGTDVVWLPCNGSANQRWSVEEHWREGSTMWLRFHTAYEWNLCLQQESDDGEGTPLVIQDCDGGWLQQWRFFDP